MKALINDLTLLRKEKKKRQEMGLCLLEGKKTILDVAQKRPLIHLLTTEENPSIPAKETFYVSDQVIKKISGNTSPDGWIATTPLPKPSTFDNDRWILALDNIQDPGNLGTLIRTALGFGFEGVFLTTGCVDFFNDKVLRATKGASLFLPYKEGTPEELLALQKKLSLPLFSGDLQGKPPEKVAGAILILGNEGQGLSPIFKQHATPLSIPLEGKVESLNVAIAGSLLMAKLKGIL